MLLTQSLAHMLLAKCFAPVLSTKSFTRTLVVIIIFSIVNPHCAAYSEEGNAASNVVSNHPVVTSQQQHSSCESCGAPLAGAVVGNLSLSSEKKKDKSLLTDSLWGNLILELAYERDSELGKLAKKVKLMNAATTVAVLGLAAATLAQGITALCVLNPPYGKGLPGVPDSYAPLNVGVATSGAMIGVMAARLYCGHKLAQHILQRQVEIRNRVQAVLAHVEYSQGECLTAQAQLTALIGTRACKEWMQLWQSSHQKLAGSVPRISLRTDSYGNALSNIMNTQDNVLADNMIAEALSRSTSGTKN